MAAGNDLAGCMTEDGLENTTCSFCGEKCLPSLAKNLAPIQSLPPREVESELFAPLSPVLSAASRDESSHLEFV